MTTSKGGDNRPKPHMTSMQNHCPSFKWENQLGFSSSILKHLGRKVRVWQKLDHVPFLSKQRTETCTDGIRNRKFIRQDPSLKQPLPDISGTDPSGQTSPDAGSPAKVDLPVKEAPTMRQTHESPQPKCTAVEDFDFATTTDCVRPSIFDDFVT